MRHSVCDSSWTARFNMCPVHTWWPVWRLLGTFSSCLHGALYTALLSLSCYYLKCRSAVERLSALPCCVQPRETQKASARETNLSILTTKRLGL